MMHIRVLLRGLSSAGNLVCTLHAIYSPIDSIAQSGLQAPRDQATMWIEAACVVVYATRISQVPKAVVSKLTGL